MINRPLQIQKILTGGPFAPLATTQTLFTGDISCKPDNTGLVIFLISGVEIHWNPGEWHTFHHVDLRNIQVQGNNGDIVTCIGDTFAPQSAGGL